MSPSARREDSVFA